MRTNYPKEYLERCQADMASRAGAVAIAKAVEDDLARLAAATKKGGLAQEEKSAVAAVADGAAGNSGTEESKEAGGGAGHQSPDATATATGEITKSV